MPLPDRDDLVLVVIGLQPRFWGDRPDPRCSARAAMAYRRSFMPSWVATKPSLP